MTKTNEAEPAEALAQSLTGDIAAGELREERDQPTPDDDAVTKDCPAQPALIRLAVRAIPEMPLGLTLDTVVPYLVGRGLMSAAELVEGGVTVVDRTRRHRNLAVMRRRGPGYLLKQADPGERRRGTLRVEAGFYRLCQEERRTAPVRRWLPRLVAHRVADEPLILELLADAEPLWRQCPSDPGADFPARAGRLLGRALGEVHATFQDPAFSAEAAWHVLPRALPWVLGAHRPGADALTWLSPADLRILEILGRSELPRELDALAEGWPRQTLIHGDVRSDNVLVCAREGGADLRLVDWELVRWGDPAWDLGSAFADFLLLWIRSLPLCAGRSASETVQEAGHPLARLRPAMQAVWSGYAEATGVAAGGFLLASFAVWPPD